MRCINLRLTYLVTYLHIVHLRTASGTDSTKDNLVNLLIKPVI